MIFDDTLVCVFAYLSGIDDDSLFEKERQHLKDSLVFVPVSYRSWLEWYLSWADSYDSFPPFDKFKAQAQMENDVVVSFQEAQAMYQKTMAVWESDYLADKLSKAPLSERRALLSRMSTVLTAETAGEAPLDSVDTFSVDGSIIKTESGKERFFNLFTKHLNDVCIVNPGTTISILGSPGSGKSSVSLNLVYLNSVLGSLNSLYIYLENTVDAYNIELLSRHSFTNGMLIENATLKRGVDPDESVAVKKVRELQEAFRADKRGNIYFASFSRFNPEPLRFANQLAKYVKEHGIQLVVLDYLQRCKSYTPLKWDSREYINQVMSSFCSCALGSFGCDPFVAVALSQPSRAAEENMLKSKGTKMTVFDAVEAPSIERDSFIVLGLYADAELRSNQSMVYKVLKNRDMAVDVSTVQTVALPQYCFVGDSGAEDKTLSFSQKDAEQMLDLGDF
jgi:hypothetical protein